MDLVEVREKLRTGCHTVSYRDPQNEQYSVIYLFLDDNIVGSISGFSGESNKAKYNIQIYLYLDDYIQKSRIYKNICNILNKSGQIYIDRGYDLSLAVSNIFRAIEETNNKYLECIKRLSMTENE